VFRLETPRLILREMGADDATALLETFSDPRVMASFPGTPPFDTDRMNAWVRRNLAHQTEHGYGLFSVVHRADGVLIGDCGLERMEIGVELGYDLRGDYWRRGLATEAATAVRDFAFDQLGLDRLVSFIRVGNQASRRVAEKVGMSLVEEIDRYGVAYWLFAIERGSVATPR
jgi:[ribosomal protein S5]-alanine N-acetyltransferase